MYQRYRWLVPGLVVAAMALTGCEQTQAGGSQQDEPAKVEAVAGTDLHRLTLTEEAVTRLGIKTEPVRADGIPMAAVVYDKDGKTWAYTTPEPHTYLRQEVTLGPVDNGTGVVQTGPAPGTAVVTVGAAELLGTEFGVGG